VVPLALRTLSVLTVLSAVSGGVLLSQTGGRAATSGDGTATAIGATRLLAAELPADGSTAARELLTGGRAATVAVEQQDRRDRARTLVLTEHRLARDAERRKAQVAARVKAAAIRAKAAAAASRSQARTAAARSATRDPKAIARLMVAERWGSGQFGCLEQLWQKESGWNYRAANPSSGAYGIPQALPGSKMAGAGSDWRTNPVTQIRWGLGYIKARYGTPCGAWAHSRAHNWY
jgi:hypothetical protein